MIKTMAATLAASSLIAFTALAPQPPKLVWNASDSVPIGLYAIRSAGKLEVTDLVLARPSEPLASFLADGGYLPRGVPLLKRIAALPGQRVCRNGPTISVDSAPLADARKRDRLGRPLPIWSGCRLVADGEVFLLNWDNPASLDGRYFGPVPASSIVGRAAPVWTREDG
jgi:conjugative transfer signal peptidase TraF